MPGSRDTTGAPRSQPPARGLHVTRVSLGVVSGKGDGMRVGRHVLASALIAVGALLLVLSVGVLAYPEWANWQAHQQQGPGPAEILPERLPMPPSENAGAGDLIMPTPDAGAAGGELAADAAPPLAETMPPGPPPTAGERPSPAPTPAGTSEPPASENLTADPQTPTPEGQLEPADARAETAPMADEAPLGDAEPEPAPAASAAAAPARPAGYGRAVWISVPRIGVDSRVVEVGVLADGEFQAPAFSVGHHVGSSNPGEPGNSVFAGHLTSINAGRVFARLHELRPGDAVFLYSQGYRLEWVVSGVRTVPNTDSSFILPAGDTRITLYTCAGQYLPLSRDYSQRLVVTGRLVRAVPRS